jgi:hypothetical protein
MSLSNARSSLTVDWAAFEDEVVTELAWTEANFYSVFLGLNRDIARSPRRNGRREFSQGVKPQLSAS